MTEGDPTQRRSDPGTTPVGAESAPGALEAAATSDASVASAISDAATDAPTEFDLSGDRHAPPSRADTPSQASPRRALETTAATLELKQVSLEAAGGEGTRTESGGPLRTAESYVGYIIDGRYHVESVIASGGMGVVYRARHRVIDKPVAIKILRPELVDNRDITERFLVEAQAASSIGNEHIVDVTDYGELPDGATYFVMEYLEGESLGRRIKRQDDPLGVAEIIEIGTQLTEGLHQAHEAQIIHRDLKPDNVLLISRNKQSNFVKILDFGIAKVQSSQNETTRAGRIFGTPHYMSPEQARGEPLDRRSDIYSLGVMLYQMMSGRLPFDGENPLGILTQHMYVEPKPLAENSGRSVPPAFEAIVAKCMSKEREDRYDSMQDVEAELLRLSMGQVPLAVEEVRRRKDTPESLRKRMLAARRRPRRSKLPWVFATILALGGAGYFWFQNRPLPKVWDLFETSPNGTSDPLARSVKTHTVALVVSPIDAHVYHGPRDLGTMPINVRIREGQVLTLDVRRPGYVSRRLRIDGSKSKAIVELSPLPGETPILPSAASPQGPAEARLINLTDAGTRTVPVAPHRPAAKPDAGAPEPEPRVPGSGMPPAPEEGPPQGQKPPTPPEEAPEGPSWRDPQERPLPPAPDPEATQRPPGPPVKER